MEGAHGMSIRTDTIRHSANGGKARRLLAFVHKYRDCCAAIAAKEWRAFFETGKFGGKFANSSKFNGFCGAAPAQMARAQVAAMLASFVSNRQNEFREAVHRSSLDPGVKHMLHVINLRKAWHTSKAIALPKTGEVIPAEVRKLGLSIWRLVRKRHTLPNARGIAPVLDTRVAELDYSVSGHADLWATFKFRGEEKFNIPLHVHALWQGRDGERCNVIQIVPGGDDFGVRLMTDVSEAFANSRAEYLPRTERLGIDFGLSTLIATDRGDLMGRGFLAAMRRLDKEITAIARHRQRSGGKPRDSRRYCDLVARVRGIIKTRVNTALNRLVDIHAPMEIVVEQLDFRMPGLSRRLNRILTNCGRAVFKAKLADLAERFGIAGAEVNPAYTSRECSRCGFVDRGNRKSQSQFCCLHCGHTAHADVQGAKVIAARRSRGLDFRFTPRVQVLGWLRKRFAERHPPATKASSGQPWKLASMRGNEAFVAGVSHGAYHECQ
jgi:putative transposase